MISDHGNSLISAVIFAAQKYGIERTKEEAWLEAYIEQLEGCVHELERLVVEYRLRTTVPPMLIPLGENGERSIPWDVPASPPETKR